ncbi:hypothetical protein AZI86_09510 [Bdellovibrio bacteriovorus]|uniref:DNA-binding response regulator n=1 Tax=Bdellovibrio bacteriovorus TaxID=959 RepID=A0A150WRZ9_BDEBC|nr:response regulator transcription factor [Bdellovibrio bacteriovorus]KYG67232.1 hypothetical protein AZI86_09510 [Bdellovibrio bacteriovorus]
MRSLCVIVEDQVKVAESLKKLVETGFPQLQTVVLKDVRETTEFFHLRQHLVEKPKIQFALIDLGLPDGSGVDLIRLISEKEPDARCVVITIYNDDHFLFEALKAGAFGYILKDDDQATIESLLRRIEADEPPLSPAIARRLLTHFQKPSVEAEASDLSPREKETLVLLSKGMTVAVAAQTLGLSPQTVAGYVKIIYQKLHVSSRAEAVREAVRRGLV